jgi:hypothetical protein
VGPRAGLDAVKEKIRCLPRVTLFVIRGWFIFDTALFKPVLDSVSLIKVFMNDCLHTTDTDVHLL